MHELSLCQAILEIAQEHLPQKAYKHVKKINLELGALLAVDQAALRFCFNVAANGTVAEQAILEITMLEGRGKCEFCRKKVKINHYYDTCENCGNFPLTITQGEELRIKFMEID